MKKALIVALALLLIGLTAWGALDKNDYKGGVFWTDRHNAVIGGITSTGYFEPLLGLNFLDDIVLSFGGTAGGTAGPFTMEWTTADPNANCFLFDMPTGGVVDVPVFMIASADSDFGYFNGTVEPTLAIENLVGTSWISLDHSATTLARLQAGGAATYLTIQTELAGSDIVLDAADAAAGTAQQYVSITGTTPIHASGTPTDIFLDVTPTISANTATATVHLVDLSFSTPVWVTGAATSTVSGVYLAPTIGAATAGTNTVNMIEIANYTGDAEVNVTGIDIGTSDGLGTAYGISVGAGWDAGLTMASPVVITIPAGGTDLETALDIDVTSSTIEANNYGIDLDVTQGSIVDDVYLSRGNLQGVRSDCVAIGNIDHVYAMRSGASIAMTADSETNQFYGGTFSAAASGAFTLTLHDGLVGFQSTVTVDSGVTDVTGGLVAAGFFNSEPIGKDITSPTYTLYLKSGGYTDFGQSIQVESNNLTAAMRIQATDSAVLPIGLQFSTQTASITNDIELSSGQFISGGTDGVPSAAGASAVEYAAGCFKTVITVDATGANDLDLEDKADGDGVLLYTFPVGHIRILGVTADLEATSSTGIDQNTFPMALGTAPGTDNTATLTGTQDDLSASQAISYDGTQDVDCPPAAAANYDGTSSAVVVYLNAAVADADISSTSTVEATGTVTIHWMNLGDY